MKVDGAHVVVQGSAPNCTNTTCNNPYTNEPECCTRECAVLGVERPIIKLKDEGDPINGGLLMEHVGSPPSASDPYTCPLNKWTGAQYERKVVYDLACDRSVVGVEIDAIEQNATNPCWYERTSKMLPRKPRRLTLAVYRFTFKMRSGFSCGCVPNCNGRECGNDDCGGSCGSCGFNQICSLTQSCCTRNCGNKNCGDDGCGGKCGHCPHGEFCNEDQVCSFPGASSSGCADGGCEGGSVAPAFFVGVLVAAVLAGGLFVMKMRGIGPFAAPRRSAGSSRDGFSRM